MARTIRCCVKAAVMRRFTAIRSEKSMLAADGMIRSAFAVGRAARLHAALTDGDPERAFIVPANADPRQVLMHRTLLVSQVEEYRAKRASLDHEIARKQADKAGVQSTILKLERTLPLVREQADA